MAPLRTFQRELERTLRIASWQPSEKDLHAIARRCSRFRNPSKADLAGAVLEVCPNTTFQFLDGVDNSDLRALLALAAAAASEG